MRLLIAAVLSATALFSSASADQVRFAKAPAEDIAMAPRPARVLDRAAVRAKLATNRAANLARFRAYQQKGVFPSNTMSDGMLNVWRDDFGNLCAAATIISASGQTALVNQVADEDNFIRLGDVTQGKLMSWILTSGLTQDEIAAIQEPFSGVGEDPRRMRVVKVDPTKRKAEDARLMAKYRQVDAAIVKHQQASLDKATDRLMKNPTLAWQLLAS
jgi:hypothetical protein